MYFLWGGRSRNHKWKTWIYASKEVWREEKGPWVCGNWGSLSKNKGRETQNAFGAVGLIHDVGHTRGDTVGEVPYDWAVKV